MTIIPLQNKCSFVIKILISKIQLCVLSYLYSTIISVQRILNFGLFSSFGHKQNEMLWNLIFKLLKFSYKNECLYQKYYKIEKKHNNNEFL